jgi:hypothetical protein
MTRFSRTLWRAAIAMWCLASSVRIAAAEADALTDTMGPREMAVGEALRGEATGGAAVTLNPAGVALNQELVFEGGFGYRPGDSASLFSATVCDSTNAVPGCFFYNYAGSSPQSTGTSPHRATHAAGMTLARMLSPRIMVGSTVRYLHVSTDIMGESDAKGFNWDAGLSAKVTDSLGIGIAGYNLWGAKSAQFPRAVGGGAVFRPLPQLAASFDARWKLDEDRSGRYGGGMEYFLSTANGQTGYPIRAGALYDRALGKTYASVGLGLATMKLGIDIAARRTVKGGDDTTLIASLRFFGPRTAAGDPFSGQ